MHVNYPVFERQARDREREREREEVAVAMMVRFQLEKPVRAMTMDFV